MPRARILAVCGVLAIHLAFPASAREVCDAADPGFAGSVVVDLSQAERPLNELTGAPLGPADLVYEFVSNGVRFRFESVSGVPLDASGFGADGLVSFGFGPTAIAVTINPPVAAVGFLGFELDGCAGGIFSGAGPPPVAQNASLESCNGFPCATFAAPAFFGAADIGGIGSVNLTHPASVFGVVRMDFVPAGAPMDSADLSVVKGEAGDLVVVGNGDTIRYEIDVANAGPDDAPGTVLSDFLPPGIFDDAGHDGAGVGAFDAANDVYTLVEDPLASMEGVQVAVDATVPLTREEFSCHSQLTNVAIVTSEAGDPDLDDNLSIHTIRFDAASVAGEAEVCDDGIDNDCNGRVDCADSPCTCRPTLQPLPGGTANPLCSDVLGSGLVKDERGDIRYCGPAPEHGCTVPRGVCGGVTVPAACCDVNLFSDPQANLSLQACDVGVPGCAPRDPNWKDAIPGVTIEGYGYTEAGQSITYILHYENVGDADAHDVRVIDVLDEDLDDQTLVIHDGGLYDPATRSLVWTDPLVPPATPRQVSFEVEVRADAQPGTRVRNVGTIVFPDAVPPTRIDTNFVEHVVPEPSLVIAPELSVLGCTETAPGSGLWQVDLGNEGHGFAYDVSVSLLSPPAALVVTDPVAHFGHPDDPADGSFTTVVPSAITKSSDTVAFTTQTPGDPCAALVWHAVWEDLAGGVFSADIQEAPDADGDAVADGSDNCPDDYNPDQRDSDGDGEGDACEPPLPDDVCDVDGDGDVDRDDVDAIFAARGELASGPDDPRDANRDGVISVNDGRICALDCSLENCEPPPAPACGMLGVEPIFLLGFGRRRWRRLLRAAPAGEGNPR